MKRKFVYIAIICLCLLTGCKRGASASQNVRMTEKSSKQTEDVLQEETRSTKDKDEKQIEKKKEAVLPTAIRKGNSLYNVDIASDKKNFDGKVDIVVGDNYYATQINDWYMYFEKYSGKVVQIEGYYINDYAPYDLIGRKGPVCPYCQGGYVSFEFLTDEDLSKLQSGKDWIKITGILRQGVDSGQGPFFYIEVLKLEKTAKPGLGTVTN